MARVIIGMLILALLPLAEASAQTGLRAGLVAFYNLENLFDTIKSAGVNDEEFTALGPKRWTGARYREKLANNAKVIAGIGRDEGLPGGPHVLALCEIENREVIEDLVGTAALAHLNYRIVHYNSFDSRGVDVALIYQPEYFVATASRSYILPLTSEEGEEYYSRSQLVVSGELMGELMHFIVNHWPSRRSGSKASERLRIEAAQLTRSIVDSLQYIDAGARIVVMGDLNDDPTDASVTRHLRASGSIASLNKGDLYNPMYDLYRKGVGSLAYRDRWNLFDQIIVSQSLLGKDYSTFKMVAARVYIKDFMTQRDGRFRGYPLRTFVGNQYTAGFSDHFPVYVVLGRER
ncbi:MAG: endonuclease/exonuclease/phosphatase family protein [Bacteroidetes bacterium]|nr:endonuclease/exonuclease/phosphatase family protein [Bacteroidota bacterium]